MSGVDKLRDDYRTILEPVISKIIDYMTECEIEDIYDLIVSDTKRVIMNSALKRTERKSKYGVVLHDKTAAAKILGINRSTIRNNLKD